MQHMERDTQAYDNDVIVLQRLRHKHTHQPTNSMTRDYFIEHRP